METIVLSGFPGVGKSTLVARAESLGLVISDSDSSQFDKADFPQNYLRHITELSGKVDIILVSSHKEVREAMKEARVNYLVVYPNPERKEEFIGLYKDRGNTESFVELLETNWEAWLDDIKDWHYGIKLEAGKFLSDVISKESIEFLRSFILTLSKREDEEIAPEVSNDEVELVEVIEE